MTDLQQLFQVIDHLPPDDFEALRRYVEQRNDWVSFVNATYGLLASDPIERGEQPPFDERDEIE